MVSSFRQFTICPPAFSSLSFLKAGNQAKEGHGGANFVNPSLDRVQTSTGWAGSPSYYVGQIPVREQTTWTQERFTKRKGMNT
jgi:hypothetical protein